MESSAVLRSLHYSVGSALHARYMVEKPSKVHICNGNWILSGTSYIHGLTVGKKLTSSPIKRKPAVISCAKTSDATVTAKSDVPSESNKLAPKEKKTLQRATFPNGFEALVLDVCDETEIAELKLKVGDFEMHLKRNIGVTKAPMSNISPTTAPPIPSKPMDESGPITAAPPAPKPSPEKITPFTNVSFGKSSKLAALEASGINNYVLVSSPTVGSFRRNRTVKGKKQPPICKEGDVIKEGQVIGYLDQFGTELPVKSDVAGEVLKLLFGDGDAVGYGDPLIAVLPSFHGIK